MVILYIIQRRKDNLMGGLEVHEHQFLLSSLKAAIQWEFMPTQYIPAKKFRAMVIGSMSREIMYGNPLHTCKEVSANGDRIEVEGHHARLLIMVSRSRKTR